MSEDVTVLVPSRGRPENLKRLVEALRDTAPGISVTARVDLDDPRLPDYVRDYMKTERQPLRTFQLSVGRRSGYAAAMNEMAAQSRADKSYLALLADDVLPETQGWAEAMIESLGDRLGVAYGDDGLREKHGPDLPTHVMIPRELGERLGWVVLPMLRHLFADNVWRELGNGLGNFQYVDVKLTHLHPWAGRAERDETYAEANEPVHRDLDRQAFEAWRDAPWGLSRCLEKLRS